MTTVIIASLSSTFFFTFWDTLYFASSTITGELEKTNQIDKKQTKKAKKHNKNTTKTNKKPTKNQTTSETSRMPFYNFVQNGVAREQQEDSTMIG